MSRENAARRLNRFKDDDDDRIFVQSPFVSARSSQFAARDTRSPSFSPAISLHLSLSGRPTPWLRQMARIYFAASGFLLSPLCIALVKHFSAFSFPFIPLFALFFPGLGRPRFSVHSRRSPSPQSGSPGSRSYFPSSIRMRMYRHNRVDSQERLSFRNNQLTVGDCIWTRTWLAMKRRKGRYRGELPNTT